MSEPKPDAYYHFWFRVAQGSGLGGSWFLVGLGFRAFKFRGSASRVLAFHVACRRELIDVERLQRPLDVHHIHRSKP